MTIERIAGESGVSTATIYKHWPSKTAIAAEAFGRVANDALSLSSTGDPLADLTNMAVETISFYRLEGNGVFLQLLAACATEPHGATYFNEYFLSARRERLEPIWEQAVTDGVARSDLSAAVAMDVLFGPVVFALLTGRVDSDPPSVRRLIELAIHGLRA